MNPEQIITNTAGITSIAAIWLYAISNIWKRKQALITGIALAVMLVSFFSVSGALVLRGIEASRFPVANMYESLLLFAWGLQVAFLVLDHKLKLAQIGWLAAACVSSVFLYASWLPPDQQSIQPLMPALVSYWRAIHVPPLMFSYALLVLAGLVSVVHLFKINRTTTGYGCLAAVAVSAASIGLGSTNTATQTQVQMLFWGGTALTLIFIAFALKSEWSRDIPSSELIDRLDDTCQRCISFAFPLLTFGIITGAFWANHAWGSYWSWDPKESMSLVTWLFYATYLHIRSKFDDRPDLMAVIAVTGLLATLLTYLGFNFLGFGGLHSYGQIR
ncbi:MAG: c-type cytochrome biogenesis protein CcsB [Cyanobacteria bacterium HKST-UBA02]|nr:c-type cytochrome biogenesis protein CcsB [Cyanobacteria bacterium HKST-UBA02]